MVLTFKSVRKSWSEKLISFYSGTVYFRLDSKAGIVLNLWPFTRTWLALDFVTLAPKLPPYTFLSLYIVLQYIFFHKSRLVKPIHMNISRKETRTTLLGDNKTNIKFPNCAVLTIPRILPFISSDDFNLEYELALTFPKPWMISNRFRTHKYNLPAENETKATPSIRYTLSTLITLRKMQPNLTLSFPHPDQTYSMNEFELLTKGTVILLLFNVTMDCLAGLYRWNAILICDKL